MFVCKSVRPTYHFQSLSYHHDDCSHLPTPHHHLTHQTKPNPHKKQVQEVARITQAVHQAKGKTGVPVVGVLLEGRPRVLQGIPDMTNAFVHAMLPGPAGGRAIADILLGIVVRVHARQGRIGRRDGWLV